MLTEDSALISVVGKSTADSVTLYPFLSFVNLPSVKGNSTPLTVTVQALSDEDRRAWLLVMEGREPVNQQYTSVYMYVTISPLLYKVYYSLRALDGKRLIRFSTSVVIS